MRPMAPKYERIATRLRQMIRDGELAPGQRLPAETELAATFEVSLPTFRQAVKVLRSEGLLEARHGVGTFVRPSRHRTQRHNSRHQWEKDRARLPEEERRKTGATEYDTGLEINDLAFWAKYTVTAANSDLAAAFKVPVGTTLLQRDYRTRKGADAPFGLSRSYLLYNLVKTNPDLLEDGREPWPGGTQHQLLTVGVEVDAIIDTVTARPPTIEEQTELDIHTGIAVLVVRKTSIDTTGRVVEVADIIWPGDRTELIFETKLERWK